MDRLSIFSRFAQRSMSAITAFGSLTGTTGSGPPGFSGRPGPRIFLFLTLFIFSVYFKSEPSGSVNFLGPATRVAAAFRPRALLAGAAGFGYR
jgi:hypothetical protein